MAEPDDELQKWFRDVPFKLKRELAQTIQDEAEELRDAIAEAAPVASGKLKESVRVTRGRNTLQLFVDAGGDLTTKEVRAGSGTSYDYALAQEFGNEHQAANPFFYSTYFERRDAIRQRISDKVAEILEQI